MDIATFPKNYCTSCERLRSCNLLTFGERSRFSWSVKERERKMMRHHSREARKTFLRKLVDDRETASPNFLF